MKPLDLRPANIEIVTPGEFLEIYANEMGNIASAEVVPGRLGDARLGGVIVVKRKRPVYQSPFLVRGENGRAITGARPAFRLNLLGHIGRIIRHLEILTPGVYQANRDQCLL